jgi:hypothetical protein
MNLKERLLGRRAEGERERGVNMISVHYMHAENRVMSILKITINK